MVCAVKGRVKMNQYVTGNIIKELREEAGITQSRLAQRLNVSDKTVSKWETGRGYPDISLLESLASELHVSVAQLLSGNTVKNTNLSSNVLRTKFYVCPVCGNIINSMGETDISCHGITLPPLIAEECDSEHNISVELMDNEYYVSIEHPMTREHNISFVAAIGCDKVQLVKLYPEGRCDARFMINGVSYFLACCNRDGLYKVRPSRKGSLK